MKKFLFHILMIVPFLLFAGGPVHKITITPSPLNPVVGELVTFTYMNTGDPCFRPNPNNNAETTDLFPEGYPGPKATFIGSLGGKAKTKIVDPATFTHIFTSPGVYMMEMDCADNEVKKGMVKSPITKGIIKNIPVGAITVSPLVSIPTLTQWGLIILGLSLGIVGIISILAKRTSYHSDTH